MCIRNDIEEVSIPQMTAYKTMYCTNQDGVYASALADTKHRLGVRYKAEPPKTICNIATSDLYDRGFHAYKENDLISQEDH